MISLVTGASGFIGASLCRALRSDGVEVRAISRQTIDGPWSKSWRVDLAEETPPEEAMVGVDCVYHLAAYTHAVDDIGDDEGKYRRINVDGTRRVLEAAATANVKSVVFISSVKAMGEDTTEALDETSEPLPITAYGRTKLEAERLVIGGGYVNHPAVLRLVPVYGAGSKGNIPRMIDAIARGHFPAVPEVGNRRSLVHVDDVVSAARLVQDKAEAAGQTFIVTDGEQYSLRVMYEMICRAVGKRPAKQLPRAMFSAFARIGDMVGAVLKWRAPYNTVAHQKLFGSAVYQHHALTVLGYEPSQTLEEALPAMVAAMGLLHEPAS